MTLAIRLQVNKKKNDSLSITQFCIFFLLKPKVRTGISKPYNVKQIKTTTAEEAEEAIRCLMEAKGGKPSCLMGFLKIF